MSALKTMVHVESRNRSCRVRKISATPDSPPCVAERMGSIYLDLGAASYARVSDALGLEAEILTLIFVAPFTSFSIATTVYSGGGA